MPQAPLKPKGGAIKKKIKVVRYVAIFNLVMFILILIRNAGVTRRGARTVPRRGKMADNEKTQKVVPHILIFLE
jgi:hypothetical protein